MQQSTSNPQQLCFSIGRPLALLAEEIKNTSQRPELTEAAEQMLEALQTFEVANQNSRLMPVQTRTALYELLTK
ncbi:MAG: hypothetical protein SW833_04360 [Cyanobacteriota bacterium]|nr:hypothetical protein [Cyanobacteriota bacterium]